MHKVRNIAKYCPKRYREESTSEAARIIYAKTANMAAKLFRQWKARWIKLIPRALACLERDFDKLIPFFEFSLEYHKVIRTTNVIERSFREVKRRMKVMGLFPKHQKLQKNRVELVSLLQPKVGKEKRKNRSQRPVLLHHQKTKPNQTTRDQSSRSLKLMGKEGLW